MNCPECNFTMVDTLIGKFCDKCNIRIEYILDKFYRLVFKSKYFLYQDFLITESNKLIYIDHEINNAEEAYKFLQKYLDNQIFE